MSRRVWVAAIAGLFVLSAGCTGQKDVTEANIVDDLVEDAGVETEDAECVADAVFEEFRQAEINEIDKTDRVDELDEETRDKLDDIYSSCDVALE